MGKRKHKDRDIDAVYRKIRRLEEKLRHSNRHTGREHMSDYSPSDISPDRYDSSEPECTIINSDEQESSRRRPSVVMVPTRAPPDSTPNQTSDPPPDPDDPAPDPNRDTPTANQNEPDPTISFTNEILEALGEAKKIGDVLGEKIPPEISERWGKILLDGLAKEQKESLMEKAPIPENFTLARAPLLNLEVSAVLSDTAKNRDKRLENAQNQLGSGITGIVNLTKDLIHADLNKIDIIKRLSEVSQILLDLHYEETMNRRRLIIPLLDKQFWNTIKGVKRDNYLFGDKLGENIRVSKEIQKSSLQIKKPVPPRVNLPKPQNSGNFRAPPRQPKKAAPAFTPAPRKYNSQPTTSMRRNNTTAVSTRPRLPPSSSKFNDRRHR